MDGEDGQNRNIIPKKARTASSYFIIIVMDVKEQVDVK